MTTINYSNFLNTWNQSISSEKESSYHLQALGYRAAQVAVIVTSIAIPTLATFSLAFSVSPSFVLLGSTFVILFLIEPVFYLLRSLGSQEENATRLEDLAQKVRTTYQKMIETNTQNPEMAALCQYQQERANELHTKYTKAVVEAKKCEKETPNAVSKIHRLRIRALDAEKAALSSKVYSLFLNTLAKHPEAFQKAIIEHGVDLFKPFSQCVKWDDREHEKRRMDLCFQSPDFLVSFPNSDLSPISYLEIEKAILSPDLEQGKIESIQNNLYRAFKEKETFVEN